MFADDINLFCSNKRIKTLFVKEIWNFKKYLNGFEQINYL